MSLVPAEEVTDVTKKVLNIFESYYLKAYKVALVEQIQAETYPTPQPVSFKLIPKPVCTQLTNN